MINEDFAIGLSRSVIANRISYWLDIYDVDKNQSTIKKLNEEEIKLPIIRISSLVDNAEHNEVGLQNNQTVFIFPGQEGLAKQLEQLGKYFTAQLFCLQYYSGAPHKNLGSLAQKLLPHIIDTLSPSKRFQIIAYSFGCSVAIEVIKLLEKQGYLGKTWFIDGAPLYNQKIFAEYYSISRSTENEIEAKVLTTCLKILIPDAAYEELYSDLYARSSWESKISFVSPMFLNYVDSTAIMELIFNYIYSLTRLPKLDVLAHQALKSKAVLIRSSNDKLNIPDDYDLSKYFETPVLVFRIEADHSCIFKDEKTIKIMLKDFE